MLQVRVSRKIHEAEGICSFELYPPKKTTTMNPGGHHECIQC
ncbi:ferredoxin-NADP reductase [Metapseudomonas resinovorans]